MNKQKIEFILSKLEEIYGIPVLKNSPDPLEGLISGILSQNTNDKNRDMAYNNLKSRFRSWNEIREADPDDISDAIRVGGLFRVKSIYIKNLLNWVYENYGSFNLKVICEESEKEFFKRLCSLKGVGVKTAAVTLLFCCGRDVFPVDTHIHRILMRTGIISRRISRDKAYYLMKDVIPEGKSLSLHINMIKLGRTICRARIPLCSNCPVAEVCEFFADHQKP